ncbi:MAG: M48 family metalloprotease [Deltaproteobacteria bacterium]|nr:M48 family metalloprotease [Deltaproteobacteria bacterium]
MPYNQIINLMLALVIIVGAPVKPFSEDDAAFQLDIYQTLGMAGLVFVAWCVIVHIVTRQTAQRYHPFALMERLQWAALLFLGINLYLLELKACLSQFDWIQRVTSIGDMAGLLLYMLYTVSLWYITVRNMQPAETLQTPVSFVATRLRMLLPALLPYMILTILEAVLQMLPVPGIQAFLSTTTASLVFLIAFLGMAVTLIPWFIQYSWGCIPLNETYLKNVIETILQRFRIRFSKILIWPQPDDRNCTAAVVGIISKFRYLLITPCLLKYLSTAELEAVIAHEIAHIRYRHMLWYVIFMLGYSLILYNLSDPLIAWIFSHKDLAKTAFWLDSEHPKMSSILMVLPFMLFIVGYFRFFMGYFMRNFEREADSAVFEIHGAPWHLINALEKIGILAGNIRNQPSWHHYSIAERTQFLQDVALSSDTLDQFKKKLKFYKMLLLVTLGLLALSPRLMPVGIWQENTKVNLTEIYLEKLLHKEQERPEIYIMVSQIFLERGHKEKALELLEKALQFNPEQPDALNNWAWITTTETDATPASLKKALQYAQKATQLKPIAPFFDTLAECYCRLGQGREARAYAQKALDLATQTEKTYYERRLQEMDECREISSVPLR